MTERADTRSPIIAGRMATWDGPAQTIRNPYDNKPLAKVTLAGQDHAEEAVRQALLGFKRTSVLSAYERAGVLERLVSILGEASNSLTELIVHEAGKPLQFAKMEVERAIFTCKTAAEEAKRIEGELIPLDLNAQSAGKFGIMRRFPIGVVLAITPFNYPLNLVLHKIAPAMAAGNSFIIKPAPQTPLTALHLGELITQAGYPGEAVNVLPCSNEVAETLVRDARIAMLTFTGSAAVGWKLKSLAGKKKVTLELGGNAACIVDKDADLKLAAKKLAIASVMYAGQVCIKAQRIYVHNDIFNAFEEAYLNELLALKVGDPSDSDTVVGPMIDENAIRRVEEWVSEAVQAGAILCLEGGRTGSALAPTVLKNVRENVRVFREEVFGPVSTLHSFNSMDEAIAGVNDTKYGLQAGIFSNTYSNIVRAYNEINVGAVIVNEAPIYRLDTMPYGGIKDSGFGREGVRYTIQEMTEPKLLVLST